jgi:hypothetical protein
LRERVRIKCTTWPVPKVVILRYGRDGRLMAEIKGGMVKEQGGGRRKQGAVNE